MGKVIDKMNSENPIGIMDSGMGGISVLREITKLMPNENYIFYGDSQNAPYGSKSTQEIYELTSDVVDKMLDRGVKAVVIACNTASSAAGKRLREKYPQLPIIAIEPALKPAVINCPGGTVLVLATEATLREQKFATLMETWKGRAEIIKMPLPGLPEFVERGELDSPELRKFLMGYFSKLDGKKIDGVVLGCTHYPFVRKVISELFDNKVKIFDGAAGTARQLRRRLYSRNMINTSSVRGKITWLNSSKDPYMIELSKKLYNMKLD
ncbi:glutamate racemase [Anaerovibrio lipolyticus]|uniref:glutamate racemase n=1 Tax=Anaerovibrio lipolyticus TaxID=82374 RepID=UPI0025E398D3|nr:glutamate racemase [Anaerovibrio lipolyticus]